MCCIEDPHSQIKKENKYWKKKKEVGTSFWQQEAHTQGKYDQTGAIFPEDG